MQPSLIDCRRCIISMPPVSQHPPRRTRPRPSRWRGNPIDRDRPSQEVEIHLGQNIRLICAHFCSFRRLGLVAGLGSSKRDIPQVGAFRPAGRLMHRLCKADPASSTRLSACAAAIGEIVQIRWNGRRPMDRCGLGRPAKISSRRGRRCTVTTGRISNPPQAVSGTSCRCYPGGGRTKIPLGRIINDRIRPDFNAAENREDGT